MTDAALTPEQCRAARALLAWSQQELGNAARVSISTVADFERGSRTPVANNLQAIREAFESRGLQFIGAGVVEKGRMPSPPAALRPGALTRWVHATDLAQWGERRDGQSGMPEMLRRLIYATAGPAASVRFPSGDSVQYPGWDGVCELPGGAAYIPEGLSAWEIGAQRTRIRAKADEDFRKRSADPLGLDPATTTFVFVTPQRFPGKDAWVSDRRAERIWRDVRVIDADDLVHWIETYPAVAQWLAVKLERRPAGLRNLEEAWTEWTSSTMTPLAEDVLLTDRDEDATAVLRWVREAPALHAIQAEAPEEGIAFLYAALSELPEAHRLSYWSRCVVAGDDPTARALVGVASPLIVVLTDPDIAVAHRLVRDGHHVFAVFGPNLTAMTPAQRLARPWRYHLQQALVRAGVDEPEAHRLATASGRSITVLRRLMPAALSYRPAWAASASGELLAALLAGGWDEASEADREVVAKLAGAPYDQVAGKLAPLAATVGGPLLRSGSLWKVVSVRDLWTQIAPQLTTDMVTRFEEAFLGVLGTVNPRFERADEDGWFERPGQFGKEASGLLRMGLGETLIAFGVYPQAASAVQQAERRADTLVHRLLDGASAQLWWSLSSDFKRLAEAAPQAFLDCVDAAFDGEDPPISALFRQDEGLVHDREYLSNLLWALEMLARSPRYLARAALILTRLAAMDPGGRWSNRPKASLRQIFVSWSPQTYAPPAARLKVIDQVIKADPAVGWRLLIALAPKAHDSSQPSPHPDWRDFTPDEPERMTWPAIHEANRQIGRRLLDQVGDDTARWRALLDLWGNFDPAWRAQAAGQLEAHVEALADGEARAELREDLRQMLQKHRGFADATWALKEPDLAPLEAIFESLATTGVEQHRWLFEPAHGLFRPNVSWQQIQEELESGQTAAAEELLAAGSQEAVFDFARSVSGRQALGLAIARAKAPEAAKDQLLRAALVSTEPSIAELAGGLLWGVKQRRGDQTLEALWREAADGDWGMEAELRIVTVLPVAPATWSAIAERSAELSRSYWTGLGVWRIADEAAPEVVVEHLLAVGRARDAVAWLGQRLDKHAAPAALLVRALKAAAGQPPSSDGNETTMFSHNLGLILKRLDGDPEVDARQVVQLEWIYFQALRYSDRPARNLDRALAEDPDFFVELIKLVFLPSEDSGVEEPAPGDREQAQAMAGQAYSVLHEWAWVPGADEQGTIDGEALEAWVKRARKLCAEARRAEIADQKIGEILSAAVRQPDEPWPPEPVRHVIEITRSRDLETGLVVGLYNRRGVTVRDPFDGGEQERELAEIYRRDAEALRYDWPRTAACLERIAEGYEADGKRQDEYAEQRDWR